MRVLRLAHDRSQYQGFSVSLLREFLWSLVEHPLVVKCFSCRFFHPQDNGTKTPCRSGVILEPQCLPFIVVTLYLFWESILPLHIVYVQ